MRVTFHRAADAFLYLPLYIAERRGIIQNIDRTIKPEFITPTDRWGRKGDVVALQRVLEESKADDTIPIAVCDPSAIFDGSLSKNVLDFKVLGALITKVPFWAIDGLEKEETNEKGLAGKFQNIIYYNETLKTGNYIGKLTKKRADIPHFKPVEFGQEFNLIFQEEYNDTLAVTADIIALALNQNHPKKKISINHNYAKNSYYRNFITTALITTAVTCTEHADKLQKILEGIEYALAVLLASKRTAISVCTEIAGEKDFYHRYHKIDPEKPELTLEQINFIINLIYEGNFYTENLKITEEKWNETLDSHIETAPREEKELFEQGKKYYNQIVTNGILIGAQQRFVTNLGISIDEISEETTLQRIDADKTKIQQKYEIEIQRINAEKTEMQRTYEVEKKSLIKSVYIGSSLLTASIFGLAFFIIGMITPFYQIFSQSLLPYLGGGLVTIFLLYTVVVKYVLPRAKNIIVWLTILTVLFGVMAGFLYWFYWGTQGDEFARSTKLGDISLTIAGIFAGLLLALKIQPIVNDSK